MASDNYRFYSDYEPEPNVSKSLKDAEDDYQLSAPYRDLLGILEAEQAWSEEDAIDAATILEKLEEWDENERTRDTTPPEGTKTIRNKLNHLYDDYLVLKQENPGEKNVYWKPPDEKIIHPFLRETAAKFTRIANPIEKLLCVHDIVIISVFIYIIGSVVIYFHPVGGIIIFIAAILFGIGHYMAYQGQPLFK